MRSFAPWRAEHGGKLGCKFDSIQDHGISLIQALATGTAQQKSKEQLNRSQSLAAAIERIWTLRRFGAVSVSIFFLWAASPLGGQSLLGILTTTISHDLTTQQLRYLDSNVASELSGASYVTSFGSMVNSVYAAVLMAPQSAKQASMDSWGNVKIPVLDSFDIDNTQGQAIKNGSWITMDQTKQANYSSLTGRIVVGISSDRISNLTI
jgi:hypothetical protein